MKSLDQKKSDPSTATKAIEWEPKARQVVGFSKGMFDYIESLKGQIISEAGGDPRDPTKKFKEENQDIATRILVEKGAGKELLKKLGEYKNSVLSIDPSIKAEFEKSLPINLEKPLTQNKSNNTWEAAYFRMVPTVAALTILAKFQNDVKTSENRIVQFCHNKVGEVVVRFDTYKAIIGQNSTYLMPGQELEITAGVGAFSKAALPTITIGGTTVPIGEDGAARTKLAAGAVGTRSVPVRITYTDQDGKQQIIEEKVEYTVGQANASIALDEMNVLYIGYDNKVTIAASGGGDDKVNATITGGGGSLRKLGGGKYIARVNSVTDDCKISVSVDGKLSGVSQFRVRTIPTPVATIGGVASNENMTVGQLRAQTGVGAYIKDFPLNLRYTVTSFTLTADNDDGDIDEAACTGNTWSPKAQQIINGMKPGRMVTVENIRATGPDGRSQKLPGLTYYIK